MPMYALYALATVPLIKKLHGNYKQVWYADDAAAVGRIADLCDWWDKISTSGLGFGYFPNASKTWLVTKEGLLNAAVSIFANTGVSVTYNGRSYLSAAIGSREYVAGQVESKVNKWTSSIQCLATKAVSQPYAAYSAVTQGLMSKWTYLSRTIPDIGPPVKTT